MLEGRDPKHKLAFVGDGSNDAPVIARGDVGVAMGGIGSDAAIEAADVVLMTDDLAKLPLAIRSARKTKRIVTQNRSLIHIWASIDPADGVSVVYMHQMMPNDEEYHHHRVRSVAYVCSE